MKLLTPYIDKSSISNFDKKFIKEQAKDCVQCLFQNYINLVNFYESLPDHKYTLQSASNNGNIVTDKIPQNKLKNRREKNKNVQNFWPY